MRKGERERESEGERGRLLAPLQRRLSHKSVLAAEAFYRRCLPHRRCRRRRRGGVNRQYTRWMRPSASPPTILGEGEGREGVEGSGGKVDRLEERKQSAADAEGRRRRRRIILAASSPVSVWWMDGWMFGCENAIARFSSSSGLRADGQAGRPSIS